MVVKSICVCAIPHILRSIFRTLSLCCHYHCYVYYSTQEMVGARRSFRRVYDALYADADERLKQQARKRDEVQAAAMKVWGGSGTWVWADGCRDGSRDMGVGGEEVCSWTCNGACAFHLLCSFFCMRVCVCVLCVCACGWVGEQWAMCVRVGTVGNEHTQSHAPTQACTFRPKLDTRKLPAEGKAMRMTEALIATGVPDIEAFTQLQHAASPSSSCVASPGGAGPHHAWHTAAAVEDVDAQVQRVLGRLLGGDAQGPALHAQDPAWPHEHHHEQGLWLANEGPLAETGPAKQEGSGNTGPLEPLAWQQDGEGDVVVVFDRASLAGAGRGVEAASL